MDFADKVVIVTGAGSGIGYEICRQFVKQGARVALNDSDHDLAHHSASTITRECRLTPVRALPFDVADVVATRRAVAAFADEQGALDVVIANAGITVYGEFLRDEPDTFDRMMAVNLRGSYFTAQAAARVMIANQTRGRIVLLSSVTGVQAPAGLSAYGVTKAGIRMMAKALAHELAAHGITVNAICPGATATERTMADPDYATKWGRVVPTGRANTVQDIAAVALFLCSAAAAQITGQSLIVDGGWTGYSPQPE